MKLRVVAVGKIAPHFKEAQDYYLKRIRNAEIVEVRKGRNPKEEGERILSKVKGFFIVLDERGKEISSREFASLISKYPNITFAIGGADGLDEEVKRRGNYTLALSKMTLQHDVARIVLLEQLFRAQEILRGSPYHRD